MAPRPEAGGHAFGSAVLCASAISAIGF